MPYLTTTLQTAIGAVSARLADLSNVRFSEDEIEAYILEALRTFNAFTGYYRDHVTFNTVATEPFYDLVKTTPTRLGYTVKDQDLVALIQSHLLEPVNPALWTGSDQFTLDDITQALQRRRDQFLRETGVVQHRMTYPIAPPPDGRMLLDEGIITVRRAAWITTDNVVTPLTRDDVWGFNHYALTWVQDPARTPDPPATYSVGETPPLVMQIVPPPLASGTLDLVVVTRGALLDPTVGVLLGVPDDWAWVVKFGALADLLNKDGLASDPLRAAYCQSRWDQGIESAKASSTVWAARIDNAVVPIAALAEADAFLRGWQTGIGMPTQVFLAGNNLLAVNPVPDQPGVDFDYGITLDIVRNAPIPPTRTEFLQVGPELLDALYGYAVHLALFKEGPGGLDQTKGLLDQFIGLCGVTLELDKAQTPNLRPLVNQTTQDETETPRMEAAARG